MISYVTGFMYSPDGSQVVLINKNKPEWQKGKFNGVGGKIEAEESANHAIAREFFEETGVITKSSDWQCFLILTNSNNYRVYMFYTYSEKFNQVKTVEKEIVSLHSVYQLPINIISNLSWLIPLSQDQKIKFNNPIMMFCRS